MKNAADVMTENVVDIEPDASVREAIAKMKERNVTSLLVQRKGPTDTWGFMSQTDVIEKVVAHGLDPAEVRVEDVMSKPVITVAPNTSIQDCAALMARADIRRVLVYDGKNILGLVSGTDIFASL